MEEGLAMVVVVVVRRGEEWPIRVSKHLFVAGYAVLAAKLQDISARDARDAIAAR